MVHIYFVTYLKKFLNNFITPGSLQEKLDLRSERDHSAKNDTVIILDLKLRLLKKCGAMVVDNSNIQIILAQSILGLKPTGVEKLGDTLLKNGLGEQLDVHQPAIRLPTLNAFYSGLRDPGTQCLNTESIKAFSVRLAETVSVTIKKNLFPLVLGGDCSILLGAILGLKSTGNYGLVFLDAHADFYEPERSVTGEVADMDLAIVTGRGPDMLTNMENQKPYVKDAHVIHLGQRDWNETQRDHAQDIRRTNIKCYSLEEIKQMRVEKTYEEISAHLHKMEIDGFWIHFDTDVLSDDINPAVDYRLPGGLRFNDVEFLLHRLLGTGAMMGMSVSIYNPSLDSDGSIGRSIAESLVRSFR